MNESEVIQALESLDGWQREGNTIVRTIQTDSYAHGLTLVQQIGELAESINHHPDMTLTYPSLTVSFTTHDAGGLTQKDLDAGRHVDNLIKR